MQIVRFNSLDELAPYAQAWDCLAQNVPFRSWTWLSTWWKHFGEESHWGQRSRELFVLAVFDDGDSLVGIAPWFVDYSTTLGSVIRMLGSGQVCSDYLTLLCRRDLTEDIAELVADHLSEALARNSREPIGWDQLQITGVDYEDAPITALTEAMRHRGFTIHRRSTINCWRIDLPTTWEAFLNMLSKNFRQEVRRRERKYFDPGRAVFRSIENWQEASHGLELLIDMHQRRQQSLGRPGCYASPRFASFIRDVTPQMMQQGQMQFHYLELDGRPVAGEYQLVGNGIVYAYQTGIDPDAAEHHPGKLANMASIHRAIETGQLGFDFLRGDEPYKAHFRGTARPSMEFRIIPNHPVSQLRHKLWVTGSNVKRWLKTSRR